VPGYFDKMIATYGENRAKAILDENRPHLAGVAKDDIALGVLKVLVQAHTWSALAQDAGQVALRTSIGSRRRSVELCGRMGDEVG
jgi:hypothetical protein